MELNFSEKEYLIEKKALDKKSRPIFIICSILTILLVSVFLYYLNIKKDSIKLDDVWFITLAPFLVMAYFSYKYAQQSELNFWVTFAKKNSAVYFPITFFSDEQSVMLCQGFGQEYKHVISFENQNNGLKEIFSFSFLKKEPLRKHARSYSFTVFSFEYKGNVPQIYLNSCKNRYQLSLKKALYLPKEFINNFTVSIPEEYEIEALSIFTPELLSLILDLDIRADIEIVNGKIFFFIERQAGFVNNFKKDLKRLEETYNDIRKLLAILKPRLDSFDFEKIGDKTSAL